MPLATPLTKKGKAISLSQELTVIGTQQHYTHRVLAADWLRVAVCKMQQLLEGLSLTEWWLIAALRNQGKQMVGEAP